MSLINRNSINVKLNLKNRNFHTPAGTVGPLERGIIKAANSGENFDAWVVGFYGEWSDKLTKLPEMHRTMNLLELKEEVCAILEEWTKESPPLSPKLMQFPVCWPLDDLPQSEAPFATREWAQRLLFDRLAGKIAFPERKRAALQCYCESISALTIQRQRTTNQPATPASQPTRPKPPQSTTQAKQGGGNRTLSSGNPPSFTERTAAWYETARRTLRFKAVSSEVNLDATLPT